MVSSPPLTKENKNIAAQRSAKKHRQEKQKGMLFLTLFPTLSTLNPNHSLFIHSGTSTLLSWDRSSRSTWLLMLSICLLAVWLLTSLYDLCIAGAMPDGEELVTVSAVVLAVLDPVADVRDAA